MHARIALGVTGFTVLFLELTLIRFLPANVLSLWYFSNIVLISSFLGIGLGALMYGRVRDLFWLFPPALLAAAAALISLRWMEVIIPSEGGEWMWNFHYRGNALPSFLLHLDIYTTLAIVFIIVAGLFALLGQRLARLMSGFKPVEAYSLDLAGSFAGVVFFGVCVFVGGWLRVPAMWFAIVGLGALALLWGRTRAFVVGACCVVLTVGLVYAASRAETWSPYYSFQTFSKDTGSVEVFANRFFFQEMVNFDADEAARWKYLLPYHFAAPEQVLILGAGTGNDVATAIIAGVPHIDAVEIDPSLVEFGRTHNSMAPYQHSSVRVFIDDARSFLKKTDTTYDMIVVGTLDSHALLSAMSTVRLDNFVYTQDSLRDMAAHLSPTGILVLQFSAPTELFSQHLLTVAAAALPNMPAMAYIGNNRLFNTVYLAGPGLSEADAVTLPPGQFTRVELPHPSVEAIVPTDDWPYLYLMERSVPAPYLKALGVLFLVSLAGIVAALGRRRDVLTWPHVNFFILGASFLLIETKSITSLSLIFGSTWIVNAFVFGAIIAMMFCANLVVWRIAVPIRVAYALLFVSLALQLVVPVDAFVGLGYWPGSLVAAGVATLPIFFSSIVFSYWFKSVRQEDLATAYGINLAGAVFGGLLEYGSMITGLRALALVAAVLYAVSFVLLLRRDPAGS